MSDQVKRGPGRPRRQDPNEASDMDNIPSTDLAPGIRRRSIGEFGKNVLGFTGKKDPNYEYRIVNDVGARIAQMLEDGWEIVEDSGQLGDEDVDKGSAVGSQVRRTVNRTTGTQGVLMRIRKEWYRQYQQAKQARVGETIKALKAPGGKSEGYYVPGDGKTVIEIGN